MSKYVQLERGNDWGTDYLARPGNCYSAAGTCSVSRGLTFKDGAPIRIRWPDGTEESVECVSQVARGSWHDYGQKGTTSWREYGFTQYHLGSESFVPFDRVLVHEDDLP